LHAYYYDNIAIVLHVYSIALKAKTMLTLNYNCMSGHVPARHNINITEHYIIIIHVSISISKP